MGMASPGFSTSPAESLNDSGDKLCVTNGIKIGILAGSRPCMAAGEPGLRTRYKDSPEALSGRQKALTA